MKSIRNVLLALSVGSLASASFASSMPNCDVKGKKVHVKNEAACKAKKGVWVTEEKTTAAPGAAPAAAPATPPTDAAEPAHEVKK